MSEGRKVLCVVSWRYCHFGDIVESKSQIWKPPRLKSIREATITYSMYIRAHTHKQIFAVSSLTMLSMLATSTRQVEVIWSRLHQHQLRRLWITTPWVQHIKWRRKFWICLFSSHAVSLWFWRQSQTIAQGCGCRNFQKAIFTVLLCKLSSQKCLQLSVICAAMDIAIYECIYIMDTL